MFAVLRKLRSNEAIRGINWGQNTFRPQHHFMSCPTNGNYKHFENLIHYLVNVIQ
jgi:hypothetical protein